MVRVLSLLLILLLVAVSLPVEAGLGSGVAKERYRAEFLSHFQGVSLDAVGQLHENGQVSESSIREAADQHAERMVRLDEQSAKLQEKWEKSNAGARYDRQFQRASATTPLAHAGIFYLQEIHRIDSNNPTGACNGNNGGHSTVAMPVPGNRDVDGDSKDDARAYVGAAHSRISVYGSGLLIDTITDEVRDYSLPVYYGGNSDFFCFEATVGPHTYVQNRPFVIGFVIGAGS